MPTFCSEATLARKIERENAKARGLPPTRIVIRRVVRTGVKRTRPKASSEEIRVRARARYLANRDLILARSREWARTHPEKVREYGRKHGFGRRRKRSELFRHLVSEVKRSGCAECGEMAQECLDFHHRDPKEKSFSVSIGIRAKSTPSLLAEIMKCDVLCANCHRKLHHIERF